MPKQKTCSKCKISKSIDSFTKEKNTKDGHRCQCKDCRSIEAKQRYERLDPETKLLKENKRREYRKSIPPELKQAHDIKYYNKNREAILLQTKEKKYNITAEQYFKLLLDQNNLCAICGKEEIRRTKRGDIQSLCVDHNHTTGEVRALLCNACNQLIGYCKEDKTTLQNAVKYLEFYNEAKN